MNIPNVTNTRERYTTAELREEFDVLGFSMGYVVLKRKADGQVGSMQFDHAPRVYYGWVPDGE